MSEIYLKLIKVCSNQIFSKIHHYMGHLNFFGIDNFKVFKELNHFDFKPINILVGTNSSGKSSFSKSILLLQDFIQELSYDDSNPIKMPSIPQKLSFQSVEKFTNSVNNKSNNPYISFELKITLSPLNDLFLIRFTYKKDDNAEEYGILKTIKIIHIKSNTDILHYDSESAEMQISFSFLKEKLDQKLTVLKSSDLSQYLPKNFALITCPFLFDEELLKLIRDDSNISKSEFKYLIEDNEVLIQSLLTKTDNPLEYIKKLEIESLDELIFKSESKKHYFNNVSNLFSDLLQMSDDYTSDKFLSHKKNSLLLDFMIAKMIEKEPLLEKYLYSTQNIFAEIAPKMKEMSVPNDYLFFMKAFLCEGVGISLDKLGWTYSQTHYIPAVRANKVNRFFKMGDGKSESYLHEVLHELNQADYQVEVEQFIERYVQLFGIANSLELRRLEGGEVIRIYLSKDGKIQELADVGYGVSQILPIILKLACLISKKESLDTWEYDNDDPILVIIEEPETNLHPALQSKLADMFVECQQKYNIQFIVETHSEYLIRKLQILTAKKKFAAKDSVIYYFNDPNNIPPGEKQVRKIEILEDGSLSGDFGSGFFDEATNWKFELMELRKAQIN